jgi:tetratricopeptide (TPR) repeat protein
MALTRPTLLLFLLFWALSGPVGAGPVRNPIQRAYRTGQPTVAVDALRKKLDDDPDNADDSAMLGAAWARMGRFSDALSELRLGIGSIYYEDDGVGAQADALRAFGKGLDAARLRLQLRVMARDDATEGTILLKAAEDARWGGNPWIAEDYVWEAMSILPYSPLVWAVLADVYLDQGDRDSADFAFWRAQDLGPDVNRVLLVETRMALIDNEPLAARIELDKAWNKNTLNVDVMLLRAELQRRFGYPQDGLHLVDGSRWVAREFPGLFAMRVFCASDAGNRQRAQESLDEGYRLYPENPLMRRAADYSGLTPSFRLPARKYTTAL